MELDEALTIIGGYGKFQILYFVLIGLVNLRSCGYLLGIVFIGHEPEHHCMIPENGTLNDTIPKIIKDNGKEEWSKCEQYYNHTNITVPCLHGWSYKLEEGEKTVVTEWDLVCDKNYLTELSTTVFVCGLMCGSLLIVPFSDRFGRRLILIVLLMVQTVFAFGLSFVTDYIQFIILRFIIGAFNRGFAVISYSMLMEVFPPSHRTVPGIAIQFFWAFGLMILSPLAYWLKDWRHLEMAISLPTVLMVAYYWIIPESIRWLIANNRISEANAILQKAAKMNGKTLPEHCLQARYGSEPDETHKNQSEVRFSKHNTEQSETGQKQSEVQDALLAQQTEEPEGQRSDADDIEEDEPTLPENVSVDIVSGAPKTERKRIKHLAMFYDMVDLCRVPKMGFYTIIVCYLWMVNSLGYYGLSLSTSALHGDRYLNFFLSGAVECPAYIIAIFVLQFFGRRWPVCIFQVISGVANIVTIFVPEETASGTNLDPLINFFAMVGKFGITGAFCSIYLYSAEIFPTVLRNTAIGFAAFWDTVGAMAAPFVFQYSAKALDRLIPRTVVGALSLTAGLLTLLLPETNNRPLPETVEDLQQWNKEHKTQNKQCTKSCSCK